MTFRCSWIYSLHTISASLKDCDNKQFSPVCVLSCSFKFPFWKNPFLQNLHWYDLSPVCVRSCPIKYPFTENVFLKTLHWNSFSPICVRSCPVKCPFNENSFFLQNYTWMTSHAQLRPLLGKIHPHIFYIGIISLQYVYTYVQLSFFLWKILCHKTDIAIFGEY